MMIESLFAFAVCSAAAVDLGSVENLPGPRLSSGTVAPGADGAATLAALVQAVRADAAQRSGVDAGRLGVPNPEDVTWSDGALGCSRPGRLYTQALVPGWRIRIEAGAQVLDYHASRRGQWLLCPAGLAVAPTPGAARR